MLQGERTSSTHCTGFTYNKLRIYSQRPDQYDLPHKTTQQDWSTPTLSLSLSLSLSLFPKKRNRMSDKRTKRIRPRRFYDSKGLQCKQQCRESTSMTTAVYCNCRDCNHGIKSTPMAHHTEEPHWSNQGQVLQLNFFLEIGPPKKLTRAMQNKKHNNNNKTLLLLRLLLLHFQHQTRERRRDLEIQYPGLFRNRTTERITNNTNPKAASSNLRY